jgi:membrane protease subunit (stomatin/prohibitin family)
MNEERSLQHYLDIGAVEIVGIEEDGEFIFKLTSKAKEVAPELWEAHQENIDAMLLELYDKGLLSVSYNEDLEATIELTEAGHLVAKQYGLFEITEGEDL